MYSPSSFDLTPVATATATFAAIGSSRSVLAPVATWAGLTVAQLASSVTLATSDRTALITITATASRPARASELANRVGASLIGYSAAGERTVLSAQLRSLRQQIRALAGSAAPGAVATAAALRTTLAGLQAQRRVGAAPLSVVSPAVASSAPISPHPQRDGAIGLAAGLLFGVMLAALLGRRGLTLGARADTRPQAETQPAPVAEVEPWPALSFGQPVLGPPPRSEPAVPATDRSAPGTQAARGAGVGHRAGAGLNPDDGAEAERDQPTFRTPLKALRDPRAHQLRELDLRDRTSRDPRQAAHRYFTLTPTPSREHVDRRRPAPRDPPTPPRREHHHARPDSATSDASSSGGRARPDRQTPEPPERMQALRARLRDIAHAHPEWGHRLAWAALLQEGWRVQRKEVRSVWREEGLGGPGHGQTRPAAFGRFTGTVDPLDGDPAVWDDDEPTPTGP